MKKSVCLNRREIITEDLGKVDFKLKMTLSSLSHACPHTFTHAHALTHSHALSISSTHSIMIV